MRPGSVTTTLRRSHSKHQLLRASGELVWSQSPQDNNEFTSKLSHFSKPVEHRPTQSVPSLKAEVFMRKLPIIDTPEMVAEVADLIETRQSSPIASHYESQKYRKLSTVPAKYRFDQGDRRKALELQRWLDAQMEMIECRQRSLPELMELKQQVVQIMLNQAISWVQTICGEWAECLRTGMKTICTLISKAFVAIYQKQTSTEKQAISECLETHKSYADLISKLQTESRVMKDQKETADNFSNNLIYNMRIRNKQCKHLQKSLKIMTNRYKQLKEELQRVGFSIADDRIKSSARVGVSDSRHERSRNNLKSSQKSIHTELSINPQILVTNIESKVPLHRILVGESRLHEELGHSKQVKFNIPEDPPHYQGIVSSNITTRIQHRMQEHREGSSYQNKDLSNKLIKKDQQSEKSIRLRPQCEPESQNVPRKRNTFVADNIPTESQLSHQRPVSSSSGLFNECESRPSLATNLMIEDPYKLSGSLMKLKIEYLERRKLLGSNHFQIDIASLDSINPSETQSQGEQPLKCIIVREESELVNSKEVQTDLTLVHASNGFNGFGERSWNRHKTSDASRMRAIRGMWMNASTQTKVYCAYNSGIVSIKIVGPRSGSPMDARRSFSLQRYYRHSLLQTIKEANTKNYQVRSSNISESGSNSSGSTDRQNKQLGGLPTCKPDQRKPSKGLQNFGKKMFSARASENHSAARANQSTKQLQLHEKGISRHTLHQRSVSKVEEVSKRLDAMKHEATSKTPARGSDSSINENHLRSSSHNYGMAKAEAAEHRSGRRNANYNVLKPKPIHHKNSVNEVKPVPSKGLTPKKYHRIAMETGGDVIDLAINSFLRTDRSSGKEHLLSCEMLEKAKETTKFLAVSMQKQSNSHNSSQSSQTVYPEHLIKQVRSMYLHGYKELVRGETKLLLTNIIINYFGIIYGNLRNVSAKEKMNKFFRKVAECQHREPTLEIFCLLTAVGTYQEYQSLLCVNDLPMYLKMFFTLNCASQDSAYTTLHKLKLHLHQIIEEFVGAQMANELTTEIKSLINSKLAYNKSTTKYGDLQRDDQHVQINLEMTCLFVIESVFKARKSFQEDFQRVFRVLDECNQTPTVSVEFFEFLNRCLNDSKIRYVSRIRTFLRECELLYKNRKCMSKQKFTMFAMKNNFPRFSQISQYLAKSMRRRTTLKHIRDFINSDNCNEEWKKEKAYLWEELTRSDKLTSTEGILIEFITNMIQEANTEQAQFLQTLYEMIYYEVFDSQAQKLMVVTIGVDLIDLYVQSILLVKDPL